MAETHRRVEPRGIVGTGMLNDPDRLREIGERAERNARDWDLPKRKFGEVIQEAPHTAPADTEWMNAPAERQFRGKKKPSQDDQQDAPPDQDGQKSAAPAPEKPEMPQQRRTAPPRGMASVRPSVVVPRKPAAAAAPPPKAPPPKPQPAPAANAQPQQARPVSGARTPDHSKQTGGHTQVTFKP